MSQFDLITTFQLISIVALTGFSAVLMVHAIIRRIKQEAERRKRFRIAPPEGDRNQSLSPRIQRTSQI